MKRITKVAVALAAASALMLTGCGGDPGSSQAATGPVEISVSAWSIETTPEFKLLVDGFNAANSGKYTATLKEYDPSQYNTLVTADLSAGVGPDVITQKEVKYVPVFVAGGQLLDVSDVTLPSGIGGVDSYKVDGKTYATPYRMDSWVLYYDVDLFKQANIAIPDGSWTWTEYAANAEALSAALGDGVFGAYQHRWQSTVQGLANAQSGANILNGEFDHLKPYYERVLKLQADKAQMDYNTSDANKTTYQAEFGKQKAAMLLMGSWYTATLIAQQKSGEANKFEWGMAPAPQKDASTTGTSAVPVTFGDPTAFGINAAIKAEKTEAAKAFLAYASSEAAAKALAGIGITPALTNDAVVTTYFAVEGAPKDDLSKFAWSTHKTLPENPTSAKTADVQTALGALHTSVMSGAATIDDALATAKAAFAAIK